MPERRFETEQRHTYRVRPTQQRPAHPVSSGTTQRPAANGGYTRPAPVSPAQRPVSAPNRYPQSAPAGPAQRPAPTPNRYTRSAPAATASRPAPAPNRYTRSAPTATASRPAPAPNRYAQPAPSAPVQRPAPNTYAQPAGMEELRARRAAAARRARQIRRNRRRLALALTVVGIFVVSGIITLLLPKDGDPNANTLTALPTAPPISADMVAPLPYRGEGVGTAPGVTVDWGSVGPRRQTENYTYTAVPTQPVTVPESGQVDLSWFSDAAFLGDSITAGLQEYKINLSGALVCGYIGASPNQIVQRTVLKNPERGEEVALDVLAQHQPKKLYVLMGTNALVSAGSSDENFLAYYGRMLDELRAVLPNATIFVQPILPVRPEALENAPGLATDRLKTVNAGLQALCAEKGCCFLDLYEVFSGADGALSADYAENDGIHLKVSGYRAWVSYLSTHVPYDRSNPYQPGAEFYLDSSLRALLEVVP